MKNIHKILTEFAQQIAAQQRIYDCTNRGGEALDFNPAITNVAKQIRQQERERVKELVNSMRPIIAEVKTNPEVWPFFDPILLKRYEAALAELAALKTTL